MWNTRTTQSVLLVVLCLAGPWASSAWADVAPPVLVRFAGETPTATAGEVYAGVFTVELLEQGLYQEFVIVGEGWTVLEAGYPEEGYFSEPTTIQIPFKARPSDPEAPIGLKLAFECQTMTRLFHVGPEYLGQLGKPTPLESRSRSRPVPDAPTVMTSDNDETQRGGGIPLRVTGRILYPRPAVGSIPAMNIGVDGIRVQLIDVDLVGDEVIWTDYTNVDGTFDSGVRIWDDCDATGCDAPDLVLRYSTDSDVAHISQNGDYFSTYFWSTPEMVDFTGDFHDYEDLIPVIPFNNPALHIWNSIIRTNRFTEQASTQPTDKVEVVWPETSSGNSGGFYSRGDATIHIRPSGQWTTRTHAHEYGHHWVISRYTPPSSDYCNGFCDEADAEDGCGFDADCSDSGHCPGCPENTSDAWNEGFPNWISDATTRWMSTQYVNDDGSEFQPINATSYELLRTCCVDGTLYTQQAHEDEAHVAALLRDIEDDNFDDHSQFPDPWGFTRDTMCLGPEEIFEAVLLASPTTLEHFLIAFVGLNPDESDDLFRTEQNISSIFSTLHGFPPDTQPLAPVASAWSPSHPQGQGGYRPCVTMAWDPAVDDVNGVDIYSFDVDPSPSITLDDTHDPMTALDCQFAANIPVETLGPQYFSIKASERNTAGYTSTSVFGPFDVLDCNGTGLVDVCDIDCFHPGDSECDLDTDGDGNGDTCNVAGCGNSSDCQGNLVPDECDIASGASNDCNENDIPDECETAYLKNWGGGSGPWSAPEGWVEAGIPVNYDHVCIQDDMSAAIVNYGDGTTITPILAADESLSIGGTSGTRILTLTEPSWIHGDLWLSSPDSDLYVDDRLDIGGLFVWTGSNNSTNAKLAGVGTTYVSGGLNIPSGVVGLNGHDLVLEPGSSSLVSGRIDTNSASSLTIRPGAVLDFQGTQHLINGSSTSLVVEGTLTKSVFTGTSNISSATQNDGLVHVQDGTLAFLAASQTTGDILGDSLTTVEFGCGGHELTNTSSLVADRVNFTGGNCGARNIRGTYDVATQTANISSSNVTFTNQASIVSYGTNLFLSSGSTTFDAVVGAPLVFDNVTATGFVYFNSGDPIVTTDLILGGGRLYGPSEITANGSFTWGAGASMYGPGIVNSNGTITIEGGGSQKRLYDRVLNIAGLAIFNGGFSLNGALAVVNNLATGVMDMRVDGSLLTSESPSFNNDGTVIKTAGAGETTIFPMTTNTGLIEVRTGTLTFRRLTQTAGQTLLNGGDLAMRQISSPQPLNLAGGSLSGNGTVTGVVNNTGGSVEPGLSAGTLTMTHDYTQGAAGRYVVELGGTTPDTEHDQLILSGGSTASLAGTLRVELINGFVPEVGDTFVVVVASNVSGIFDTIERVGFPADRDVRIVDLTGGVTLQVFDPNCDGVVDNLGLCPDAICPVVSYTLGSDPQLSFVDPAACPAGILLPGLVDFAEGRSNALSIDGGNVPLGVVAPVECGEQLDAFLWVGAPPLPGNFQFFLARPMSDADYGQASGGETRLASFGDCP